MNSGRNARRSAAAVPAVTGLRVPVSAKSEPAESESAEPALSGSAVPAAYLLCYLLLHAAGHSDRIPWCFQRFSAHSCRPDSAVFHHGFPDSPGPAVFHRGFPDSPGPVVFRRGFPDPAVFHRGFPGPADAAASSARSADGKLLLFSSCAAHPRLLQFWPGHHPPVSRTPVCSAFLRCFFQLRPSLFSR